MKIDFNNDKMNYKVKTIFGDVDLDVEKFEDKIIFIISSSMVKKEFDINKDDLIKSTEDFLSWLKVNNLTESNQSSMESISE